MMKTKKSSKENKVKDTAHCFISVAVKTVQYGDEDNSEVLASLMIPLGLIQKKDARLFLEDFMRGEDDAS